MNQENLNFYNFMKLTKEKIISKLEIQNISLLKKFMSKIKKITRIYFIK